MRFFSKSRAGQAGRQPDALLHDKQVTDNEELARILGAVQATFGAVPTEEVRERHLAAMLATARDAALTTQPLPQPRKDFTMPRLLSRFAPRLAIAGAVIAVLVGSYAVVSPDNESDINPQLIAAQAAQTQEDFEAACQARVEEMRTKAEEHLSRLAEINPELAAQFKAQFDAWIASLDPATICSFEWGTFVGTTCEERLAEATERGMTIPEEALTQLPPEVQALIADPCNADWASVDWSTIMGSVDFNALIASMCDGSGPGGPSGPSRGPGGPSGNSGPGNSMGHFRSFCNMDLTAFQGMVDFESFDFSSFDRSSFDPSKFDFSQVPEKWRGLAQQWATGGRGDSGPASEGWRQQMDQWRDQMPSGPSGSRGGEGTGWEGFDSGPASEEWRQQMDQWQDQMPTGSSGLGGWGS